MENNKNKIIRDLNKLGLEKEHALLYLELLRSQEFSALELSRALSMGRNKIYRLLKELEEMNLVNRITTNRRSTFEAQSYENLRAIVEKRKEQYKNAEKGFSQLVQQLPYLQQANAISSNVIHYNGIDGLKQVNWNLVHAKDMYRVYEVSRLSDYLNEKFAEDLRLEWLRRKIYTRDLTNDISIEAHTSIKEFTEIYSEYRHISPEILKINTEMYIYNDVVTLIQYDTINTDPHSIFCVEVHNQALAQFQKQIYDIIWEQAEILEICGPRGKRALNNS